MVLSVILITGIDGPIGAPITGRAHKRWHDFCARILNRDRIPPRRCSSFPTKSNHRPGRRSRRQLAVIKYGWELRMCHNALLGDEFYEFLLRIDKGLAAETQAGGCRRCGSALHKNRYERKPRGGGLIGLGKGPHFHFSLSCSRCEKRHNPRSVRFLGRRVYLAAIVVLASALRSGLTDRRAKQLTEWLRVRRTTIKRWRAWWLQGFVESSSGKWHARNSYP